MFRWNISLLRKYQKFHLFSSCICLSQIQLEIKKMALYEIFHSFLPPGTHTHPHPLPHPPSTISSRGDTTTELVSFLPQTKNVLNKKICALQEARFRDAFFDGSGSVSFFSVYTCKHKYVPLRKTLVSIRNHSCSFSQLWFRLGDWSFSLGHEK